MGTTFPYSKFLFHCHCSSQVDQTPKTPRQPTWAVESFVPMILSSDKLLNLTQVSSLKECLWGKSLNISDQACFVMWQEITNQRTTNDAWSGSNWKLFRSYSTDLNSEVAGKPANKAKTQMVEQMQLMSSSVLYQTAEKQLLAIKMAASVSKVGKHKLQQICYTCHAYESTQNAGKFVTIGVT